MAQQIMLVKSRVNQSSDIAESMQNDIKLES